MKYSIEQANESHLESVVPLFDDYRQFYGQLTDLFAVREFLQARFESRDSVILVAMNEHNISVGFTQLYPSFSSVAMQRIWILNDLFVCPPLRRQGVGSLLLNAAKDFACSASAVRLVLATGIENHAAQSLYQENGWQLDKDYCHYLLPIKPV